MAKLEALVGIAMNDVKARLALNDPNITLSDRVRICMDVLKDHWLISDEEHRFRASIACAIATAPNDEQKEALIREFKMLSALTSAMSGIPVNLELAMDTSDGFQPVGMMRIWNEVLKG